MKGVGPPLCHPEGQGAHHLIETEHQPEEDLPGPEDPGPGLQPGTADIATGRTGTMGT